MTSRLKIIAAIRGEIADSLLFMPRLDLWYAAAMARKSMPSKYIGLVRDEISKIEGWVPYRFMPDFLDLTDPSNMIHRSLGLISNRFYLCRYVFGPGIEIRANCELEDIAIEYRTPLGAVRGRAILTEEQKKNGATYHAVTEHLIKGPEDYKVLSYIFQNVSVVPDYEPFLNFQKAVGDATLCFAAAGMAASPFHHILRDLVDPTTFYMHYQDYEQEMRGLAEAMTGYYRQLIQVVAKSPAEAIVWGANYDDALTYPAFFEKDMLPWIQEACCEFHKAGKIVGSHCDGENLRLMDLIIKSGLDVADSVCPHPTTKIRIKEYHRRWGGKLTIFGGIPQDFLLPDVMTVDDLNSYMDHFFDDIAPGDHFIVGIADAVPPDADFDRLHIIAERVEKEGRLPLAAGSFNPVDTSSLKRLQSRLNENTIDQTSVKNMAAILAWANSLGPHTGAIKSILKSSLRLIEFFETNISSPAPVGDEPEQGLVPVEKSAQDDTTATEPASPYEILKQRVLKGDETALIEDLNLFLQEGYAAQDLLKNGLLTAMETIGQQFKNGTVFIPEVLFSARALNRGVALLEPYLSNQGRNELGTVMIGTVYGDLHDIGKNIVLTMLRGVGFKTIDLGMNVPVEDFIRRVKEDGPDILGLSALLTTTMPEMQKVINALKEAGLREKVKVIVGGAPVSEQFAMNIGADCYAEDAGVAVDKAKKMMGK
jgi:corrinoid protein of di/trimethylamine methyltransferase